ncbi:hypothetical protein CF641_37410, partial [Burkholderia pseudomallei]
MGQHGRPSPRTRGVIGRGRRGAGNAPRSRGRLLTERRREGGGVTTSTCTIDTCDG